MLGNSANSYQYTGREADSTGLYYYRTRYYNPTLGRFISEDAAKLLGGGSNLFTYVGNDPVDYVDALGLDKEKRRFDCANQAAKDASVGGNLVTDAVDVTDKVLDFTADPSAGKANDILGDATVSQSEDYAKTKAARGLGHFIGVNLATLARDDWQRALAAGRVGARVAERVLVVKDATDIAIWLGAYYYSCNIDW